MKRILSILLTAGLTAAFFSFTAPSAQELEIITLEESAESNVAGDVTGDGTLNRQDLLRLAKHFAGWDVEIHEKNSDVTGDGTINRQDLLRLAKHFAGWDVTLDRYPEPEPEPDPEPEPEPDPEPEPEPDPEPEQPTNPEQPETPDYDSDEEGWSGIYRP